LGGGGGERTHLQVDEHLLPEGGVGADLLVQHEGGGGGGGVSAPREQRRAVRGLHVHQHALRHEERGRSAGGGWGFANSIAAWNSGLNASF
jgi:hypothetical protein